MTKAAGKSSAIYIAGYDLSGSFNKASPTIGADLADVTGFQESGHRFLKVLNNDGLAFSGFFEAGEGEIDAILESLKTTECVICALIDGTAIGSIAYCADGQLQDNYQLTSPVDGVCTLEAAFKPGNGSQGKLEYGKVLQNKATKSADDQSSGRDDSSSSSDGAVAFLQVFACGADDDLIVKIQDDDNADFSSPNDLITFTTATGITSERKAVTGTVQRYVRVDWGGAEPWEASFAVVFIRL